jgi:hypothetical protein
MNKNSKEKAQQLRKEIAALHRVGQKVMSPASRRRSRWKGALFNRRPQTAESKIAGF